MTIPKQEPSDLPLWQMVEELRARLAEAEEILQAIAHHEVDAFVIKKKQQEEQVFTLQGADHAYQLILETINEGTATLGPDGIILYCNQSFARLLELPLDQVMGAPLVRFVKAEDLPVYSGLIEQAMDERSRGEVMLQTATGMLVPVLLSCSPLRLDEIRGVCLVATDLTEQKRQQARKQVEEALRQARDELEQRVTERTWELLDANRSLQREAEERKRTEAALAEVRRRLSQSQEAERLLLAQELHDGPLQDVIAVTFELSLLAETLHEEEQLAHVTAIHEAVHRIARQLRTAAQTLRPPVLAQLGLATALRTYTKQLQEAKETPTLTFVSNEEVWAVPEETALALLRIGQQSLHNALQHAQAKQVRVYLHHNADGIRLEIEDDGKGFQAPEHWVELARKGHLGIVGMAERATAIGGQFELFSQPGQGTRVSVTVPKPTEHMAQSAEQSAAWH